MTVTTRTVLASTTAGVYSATSVNGPWTSMAALPTNYGPYLIVYGADKFIAVSQASPEYQYYSYDGISWTASFTAGSAVFNYIANYFASAVRVFYKGGKYWITVQGGIVVSNDGISWSPFTLSIAGGGPTAAANVYTDAMYRPENGMYLVCTSAGDIWYTYDADPTTSRNWSVKSNVVPGVQSMAVGYDATAGANIVVATSNTGKLYTSTDGLNYTVRSTGVVTGVTQVHFHRTDDPAKPSMWLISSLTNGTVWYSSSPTTGFSSYTPTAQGSAVLQLTDSVWDGTKFALFGKSQLGAGNPSVLEVTLPTSSGTGLTTVSMSGVLSFNNNIISMAAGAPNQAPTAVTPGAGSTVNSPGVTASQTSYPIFGADYQNPHWQFDRVSTFDSSSLVNAIPTPLNGFSGPVTSNPAVNLSNSGTWYVRARSIAQNGLVTPWSSVNSFTLTIPSVATPTSLTVTNTTDYWPTFGATMGAYSGGNSKLEFQMATDSGFSNIINSYLQPDSYLKASGASASPYSNTDTTSIFPIGTYYLRARTVTQFGNVSAWSAGVSWTQSITAPYWVVVTNGPTGTVGTSHPTLAAGGRSVSYMTNYNRYLFVEWQTASDSGFTVNSLLTDDVDLFLGQTGPPGGYVTGSQYVAGRIVPGTTFLRSRLVDAFGFASAWTSNSSFLISHPPASLPVSPNNGDLVNYDTSGNVFTWKFNDTSLGDAQTSFQVILSNVSDGSIALDSGKVSSTSSIWRVILSTGLKGVALNWTVRSWDTDDNPGPFSTARTVTFIDQPVISMVTPTNSSTVTTGRPPITWSIAGTGTQKSYSLTVTDTTTLKTVFSSNGTSAQSVTPAQNVLSNSKSYMLRLKVVTSFNTTSTISIVFSASYSPPVNPGYFVDASGYSTFGYININWAATVPDPFFYTWTVYRRISGLDAWETLFVTTNASITDYHDWSAITGIFYEYIVSQDADRSGILLGSPLDNPNPAVIALSGNWWFIDTTDETNNFYLNVTSDTWTDEFEETTFTVVGRGRAKDVGTHLGLTGSVTGTLRPSFGLSASQRYYAMRDMRYQNKIILLRDPFGNFYNVAMGNIQYSHTPGVGSTEMYEVTIPLDEVII